MTQTQSPTASSKPTQQAVSPPQTAQPPPPSQNSILFYLIVISLAVGIIWYAINTLSFAIDWRISISIIGSTVTAVVFAFYGYQAGGGAFIFLTILFVGIPWGMLFAGWQNPTHFRNREESFNFIRVLLGMIPPLILLYILTRELSAQDAYCIVCGMSSLLFWGMYVFRGNSLRAEETALKDAERKQHFITSLVPYALPVSRFLSRYHPTWYPSPISQHLTTAISTYAKFLRDLACANGETPSTAPDDELIQFPFTERSFPESWNYEKTNKFCSPMWCIIANLAVCAELTLEENKQYDALLTKYFAGQTDEERQVLKDQWPPFLREKTTRIFENQKARLAHRETQANLIESMSSRLTALIPDYIASIKTVIGTPPNGLPIAYDSLESRYRHTFLLAGAEQASQLSSRTLWLRTSTKGTALLLCPLTKT